MLDGDGRVVKDRRLMPKSRGIVARTAWMIEAKSVAISRDTR